MNPSEIKSIYDRIVKLTITLHSDPASLGPKYLQDVIATCNNFKNEVSGVLSDLMRRKHLVSRNLQARQAAFQVGFDDLLANNEAVRRLPNIEDRKATANVMLRTERQTISQLESELKDLEAVEKVVRHRHKELSDTMAAIKVQRSLIRDEIDTKSFYGDERITRGAPSTPLGDDLDDEALAQLFEGGEAAAVEATEKPSEPSDDQAIQAFLAEGKTTEDESFEDVFSSL